MGTRRREVLAQGERVGRRPVLPEVADAAKAWAVASPMPELAPLTSATEPVKSSGVHRRWRSWRGVVVGEVGGQVAVGAALVFRLCARESVTGW